MTINQLHKITAALIGNGAGRRGVCVSKETFTHPLESDGATETTTHDVEARPHRVCKICLQRDAAGVMPTTTIPAGMTLFNDGREVAAQT